MHHRITSSNRSRNGRCVKSTADGYGRCSGLAGAPAETALTRRSLDVIQPVLSGAGWALD